MLGVVVFWDIAGYDIFDYYRFKFYHLLRFRIEHFLVLFYLSAFCFACEALWSSCCFKVLYKYILTLTLLLFCCFI